jgi:uncharacterized ferredoxin-like protein
MSVIEGIQAVNENLLAVAKVGASAALRAPVMAKSKIKTKIITNEDFLPMVEMAGIVGEINQFVQGDYVVAKKALDAGTPIIELLIGVDATVSDLAWNCGACGFNTCAEFNRYSREHKSPGKFMVGPSCNWKLIDHGIAMSYGAAAISAMNVECRMQADYGSFALLLGYMEGCNMCVGISLGPYGESIWYNRVDSENSFDMTEHMEFMQNTLPQMFISFPGDGRPPFKSGSVWGKEPKFFKPVEDPELMAKQQKVGVRIGEIISREMARKAAKK